MRSIVVLLALASIAALAPAAALASPGRQPARSSSAPAAVLPPDLVALEQRMSELQLTSERFVLSEWTAGGGLPKELAALLPKGELAHGLLTLSPPAGEVTLKLFGESLTSKLVDGIVYLDVPAIAKSDGGRPWVEIARRDFHKYFGGALGIEGSGQPGPVAVDPFAALRARVNRAQSVAELGALTVDGQSVTGFRATLAPVVMKLHNAVTGRRITLRTTEKIDFYLAADGVPVRTRTITTTDGVREITAVDISAVNEPLIVAAPPAAQTITLSQLAVLVRKAKAEAKARARRRAREHAGKKAKPRKP